MAEITTCEVQALCLSLEDSAYLVQRCVLDLLISCFPIHKCQLPRSDILNVLTHAVTILLRRDMSLNRRLNAWLLGTDLNGVPVPFIIPQHLQQSLQQQQQSQLDASSNNPAKHSTNQLQNVDVNYFNIFTKDLLILAIKSILNSDKDFSSSSKQNVLLSLKTMISLLDRPEIVSTILNDLLLDVLRTLYRECHTNLQENVRTLVKSKVSFTTSLADESLIRKIKLEEKQAAVEIYKTANILFTKFDPSYIWNFIAKLFGEACKQSIKLSSPEGHSSTSSSPPSAPYGNIITIREFVDIVTFLLDKLSLETYFEMNTQHFPNMLIHIVQTLQENYKQLSNDELVSSLKLCSNIITRIISYCHSISMDYVRNRTGGHKRGKQFREVGASNCTTANVADDKAAAETVNDVNAGEVDEHNDLDDEHDFEMVGEIVNKQFLNNNADNNDDNDDVTVSNDSNEINESTRNCGNDHQSATKIIKDVNCRFLYQAGYVNRNSSLFTFIDKFLIFFEAVVENRIVSSSNLTNLTIDYLFTHSNKTASWKDYHSKISKVISTKKINFKSKAEHETLLNHLCLLLSKSLSLSTYNASFNDIGMLLLMDIKLNDYIFIFYISFY
ncbi:hypothetical protein HELRODRAFT_162646 [Helobdella robusta]|uniref:Uncharacterized protein n=1 Tax=Helobdella robusta TaxID=6412 RepID=T1ESY9_HELRO|nr:hypothetical protein HELRODRAFT_162646 [Helobdella robusta]ESN99152.1 hypothetical protein HELRODRAFT_162646 [Helobdella robusta]